MSIGEWISKGINKQVGQQPESIKNAASRWVDKTFGKADASIVAFVRDGVVPESPQAKMDLADAVANTPNYLLEKTVRNRREHGESSQQAIDRVTNQVVGLFNVVDLATQAHTEDVRSEKAIRLGKKPQVIFNDLLQKATSLETGSIAPKLRLAESLNRSGVVLSHGLVVDESGRDQSVVLIEVIQDTVQTKLTQRVEKTMNEWSADSLKAKYGLRKYGELAGELKSAMGDDAEMPESAREVVTSAIPVSIQGEMNEWSDPSLKEKYGRRKFHEIKDIAVQILGDTFSMPENAIKIVEPFGLVEQ